MNMQRAVVVGLGLTGLSVIRYLLAHGVQVVATDTRAAPPALAQVRALAPHLRLSLGGLDVALLADADCVVTSPGLPLDGPFFVTARGLGLPVIGDIELFAQSGAQPVVAITGTNGKSTVATLAAKMAQAAGIDARAGGNLGPPALDLLSNTPAGLYVLELSSYQLETTRSLKLAAAAVLNVTPDHLDRHHDIGAYVAAKANIFTHAAVAIVNMDDPLVPPMVRPGQSRLRYSMREDSGADLCAMPHEGRRWVHAFGQPFIAVDDLGLKGEHNIANALAALAVGEALGLKCDPMKAAMREFRGLDHRTQWVRDVAGVRYVDDSKGTNVGATVAAMSSFEGPLLLIAGGDGKNQDFAPLHAATRGKLRRALLIGRDARRIATALDGVCEVQFCDSLEQAVNAAAHAAKPGDTVLLSPACASVDMFRDYGHRGQVFAAAVQELPA
ncbi:MAG: UDP-N-acetylmuramoyl-L-alanine--D-glutamate ligase [Nevskiaceae bacterium]|jgi:UDP-N-acetylmuramoylalanine--D-glutamate ligase|nr:UDP-N-acetylmuramoyl-L-alanine--D-glutamate ligase [Nevskiaceae bacterium]